MPLGIICLDEEVLIFYSHLLRKDRLINKTIRKTLKLALAYHDLRLHRGKRERWKNIMQQQIHFMNQRAHCTRT